MLKVEFLGTGGAIPTPVPGCDCRVCRQARDRGVPYSRLGPSLFVHGPDVLIDTPEEIRYQLNRSTVGQVCACLYSHWHPDHVMGRRIWEMNKDWRGWPRENACTDIYIPSRVGHDFRHRLGTWEHLAYLQDSGLVRLIDIPDGEAIRLRGTEIRPIRLAVDYAYAFLFDDGARRLLVAPDELLGWVPTVEVESVDLAVIPMGVVEFDPFSGTRRISEDHSVLRAEATFRQTLEIAGRLQAGRVVMTHIEEPDGLSHDDLTRLEGRLRETGLNVSFAYDTLVVQA
jgi:phosphoribosyl 1,2-cyclic phosphate phosphodiesterase